MPQIPTIPAGSNVRVSRSVVNDAGDVAPLPAALLAQCHALVPSATADDYALARVIASELGNGALAEQCCIADADVNRATRAGKTLLVHIAPRGVFGRQGSGGRVVASSQDPTVAHVLIAQAVRAGSAKGIALDAVVYFDPWVQWDQHKAGKKYLAPDDVLTKWSFNRTASNCRFERGRYTCALSAPATSGLQEWVGPIAGVRPTRLMLLRPKTAAHATNTQAARDVIATMQGLNALGAVGGLGSITLLALWALGTLCAL